MKRQDLDPDVLDNPEMVMPNQPGMDDKDLKGSRFEKGLRYVLYIVITFVAFESC